MNYVYDVLLNFKYPLYPFYEWNIDDFIINMKRIPIYKIKSDILYCFKSNKFKINILNIKGKTKTYNTHKSYLSLIYTDGNEAVAFNFDNKGVVIGKSSILPDEENEILESSKYLNDTKIDYQLLSIDNKLDYKTRNEIKVCRYLENIIKESKDNSKIKYISFECFNKDIKRNELIRLINEKWSDKYLKIYDFFKSNSMNNN